MSQEDDERDRGFLTPTDREFLKGQKEYANKETGAHRKADIRNRVRNAILDFELLAEELDREQRDKIFGDVINDDHRLHQGIESMIAFLILGLEAETIENAPDTQYRTNFNFPELDWIIQGGVWEAMKEFEFFVTEVDSTTTATGWSEYQIEVLKNKFGSGNADLPTADEVGLLLRAEEIDREKLLELLEEEFSDPSDSGESEQ